MGKVFDSIDEQLRRWIDAQPMWFVATAPLDADGRVNVSPRGGDSLSVLGAHRVGWVDFTGSGIETIAHLRENGRACVMFASFDLRPRIVRLHGRGQVHWPGTAVFEEVTALHPPHPSTRAVITVDVERISDSCGWGVPVMDVVTDERELLRQFAEKKGPDGMDVYRAQKNTSSIDGLPGL
ncbi:pyridoxamine 5'-phosphate oxidase family protein [Kineococcus xinjiangensis]|nr:pyridoxamine 5'-phosphate oxidase family protein [Kineococcus xinjiangensis]